MGNRRVVVAFATALVAWSVLATCIPPPQQQSNATYGGPPGAYSEQRQQTAAGCRSDVNCRSGEVCLKENAYGDGTCVDGCSSDYSCPYGSKCVKGQYDMTGVCAQSVNEYGTPTYEGPSSDSVGPGDDGDCGFDTDCAIGFSCVKQGYSIRGHCMK